MSDRIVKLAGLLLLAVSAALPAAQMPELVEQLYGGDGVSSIDTGRGRALWLGRVGERGCTDCHGERLGQPGKHVKTGKVIKAMSPSVNPDRYRDERKIEKWFSRNCDWTFGRECSAQEKADILGWLLQQ